MQPQGSASNYAKNEECFHKHSSFLVKKITKKATKKQGGKSSEEAR
jgi:hypothetical protein